MRVRSIEQKIFLLILPICLIPPILLVIFLGVGSRLTFEDSLGTELASQADYFADRFDQYLIGKSGRLAGLVQGAGGDMNRLANEAHGQAAAEALVCIGSAGRLQFYPPLSAPNPPLGGGLPLMEGFFHEWSKNPPAVPTDGMLIDYDLRQPGRLVSQRLLLFVFPGRGGEHLFLIYPIDQIVKEFHQSWPQAPNAFMIYSQRGFFIYPENDPDDPLVSEISNYINRQTTLTGWFTVQPRHSRPYLVASAISQHMKRLHNTSSHGAVWLVLLQYDMENFMGPLDKYLWLSVVAALGLVLVMLVVAYAAARNLISPILTLRRQAEALAGGDLDVRASIRSGDEIGELADAFNIMATRLRTTYRALEERLEENELRSKHINVINEITSAIVQVLSMDAIFEILNRELDKLLPFSALWIALYDPQTKELQLTHIHPSRLIALFDRRRIPLSGSLHGHVLETSETLHAEIGPYHRGEFFETRIFKAEGFQSYLIAPLPSRSRIIGTLTVASTAPDAFNARLAPVMSSLASAVAIAIEQTELFQHISQFAAELERKVDERTHELEVANRKLLQTEKYFATGRMAGNLAHEINNPLGIIKNYLQLVRNSLKAAGGGRRQTDPNLEHVEIINEEVNRIARLVRQMLDLHRPVEQKVQPVDVNGIIHDILTLMDEELKQGQIEVTCDQAADLPQPLASPDLIRQLLLNLVRNAQDAMEGGGQLSLRTSVLTQWADGREQQSIHIRVADSGCGIAPEDLLQIFDPFFTTKTPDKGTGLGLCVSYSIVSMYHGTIDVKSEVGKGTQVTVTLPIDLGDEDQPDPAAGTEEEGALEVQAAGSGAADGAEQDPTLNL